jgi:parvulin-like peptidyl-prolyl isomerase
MKRLFLLLPVALATLLATSCSQIAVAAATVNGDKISEAQVEHELDRVRSDPTFQDLVKRQGDEVRGFARRQILTGLIRQEILAEQARKMHLVVTSAQEDKLVSDEAARSGMAVKEFLRQQNLSAADAKVLAERVVREFELKSIVAANVTVDPKQVSDFYSQNKSAFEQVHLARITTRTDTDARAAIEELASGHDFADVARRRSIDAAAPAGGDLGYQPTSSLSTDVQAAVAQVQPGGLTAPVQTQNGFEVYRVLDRRVQPLSDVQDQIRSQLGSQTQDQAFESWVRHYMAAAKIVVNPQYGRFDRTTLEVVAGSGRLPA